MKPAFDDGELEAAEAEFKPLTVEQAQALRQRHPPLRVWRIVAVQALVAVVATLAGWAVTGQARVAASLAWGAFAVVGPAAVFVCGVSRVRTAGMAAVAAMGFAGWEIAKLALSAALLALAPWVVERLSWPALLAGVVVATKAVWLALWLRSRAVGQRNLSIEELGRN